jgi:hypothetical protein
MVSRYFSNPKWRDRRGRYITVMEVENDTTAQIIRHKPLEYSKEPWQYAALRERHANGLQRCLQAVQDGSWVELTYQQAFPPELPPATPMENAW